MGESCPFLLASRLPMILIKQNKAILAVWCSSVFGSEEMGSNTNCAFIRRSLSAPSAEHDVACKKSTALFIRVNPVAVLMTHAAISDSRK